MAQLFAVDDSGIPAMVVTAVEPAGYAYVPGVGELSVPTHGGRYGKGFLQLQQRTAPVCHKGIFRDTEQSDRSTLAAGKWERFACRALRQVDGASPSGVGL